MSAGAPLLEVLGLVREDLEGDRAVAEAVLAQHRHRAHQRVAAGVVLMEQVATQQHKVCLRVQKYRSRQSFSSTSFQLQRAGRLYVATGVCGLGTGCRPAAPSPCARLQRCISHHQSFPDLLCRRSSVFAAGFSPCSRPAAQMSTCAITTLTTILM